MTIDINNLWLGRMQQEIGVLSSNVMLLTLQCDALRTQAQLDAELIEALKRRCQAAEQDNQALKAQIQPAVQARARSAAGNVAKNVTPSGSAQAPRGTHPDQSA